VNPYQASRETHDARRERTRWLLLGYLFILLVTNFMSFAAGGAIVYWYSTPISNTPLPM
jgi:hypothetical protein